MKTVHRFDVPMDNQPHAIPSGRIVLFDRSARHQTPDFATCVDVWVELDDLARAAAERGEYQRAVQVVGTGWAVPDDWEWRGSFVDGSLFDGSLVWHLYDLNLPATR